MRWFNPVHLSQRRQTTHHLLARLAHTAVITYEWASRATNDLLPLTLIAVEDFRSSLAGDQWKDVRGQQG